MQRPKSQGKLQLIPFSPSCSFGVSTLGLHLPDTVSPTPKQQETDAVQPTLMPAAGAEWGETAVEKMTRQLINYDIQLEQAQFLCRFQKSIRTRTRSISLQLCDKQRWHRYFYNPMPPRGGGGCENPQKNVSNHTRKKCPTTARKNRAKKIPKRYWRFTAGYRKQRLLYRPSHIHTHTNLTQKHVCCLFACPTRHKTVRLAHF